jgi:hypothetical protein
MVRPSTTTSRTIDAAPGAPVAARPLRIVRPKKLGPGPGALEAEAAMGQLHQPHFSDHVVIFIERQSVDADRDGAAALVRGRDRREAGVQCSRRSG